MSAAHRSIAKARETGGQEPAEGPSGQERSGLPEGSEPAEAPRQEERELVEEPAGGSPPPDSEQSPAGPARVIVPRWVQLVMLPLAVLAVWALARAAGKVLLIFIVAAVIALILNPIVALVQSAGLRRGLAVLVVYVAFFLMLAGVGLLLANPVSNQVQSFSHSVPHIVHEANSRIVSIQGSLNKLGLHLKLVKQGETALQTLREHLSKSLSSVVSFGGGLLTEVVGAAFDLLLVFVLSVYLLLYGQQIGDLVRRAMPRGDGTPEDDYPTLVQHAVSRYVGGQLLFSFVMGLTAGITLYIYGVLGIFPAGSEYAVAFAVFFGLMELVPYIGPILGALPPVLVALFTNPVSAIWVALLFVGLQQLEGHIVAPQIFGHTLRINPLLVIFALLLGQQLYGLIGVLVALPIISVIRETAIYLSRHLTFEPWEKSSGGLL
jgi:predicted PurR-regulated permease PerM